MAELFPHTTTSWKTEKTGAFRRLTLSLPQMALVTGIVLRLWRSYTFTHGSSDSWLWIGGTTLAGIAFLYLMCAIHLANFTLRNWVWRAPLFAVLESSTEIVMSLALITVNMEPLGADMAEFSDWLPTAAGIFILRVLGVIIFSLVLGIVVWVLRRLILAKEHRGHTVAAVHRATAEMQAEHAQQVQQPGASK